MRTLAIGPLTRSSNAPGSECKGPVLNNGRIIHNVWMLVELSKDELGIINNARHC
jgi:hypothetical protein